MTAPLTPHDPQPPTPWGSAQAEPKARVGRESVIGLATTAAVAASGVILGLLWLWLAPRVPLISSGTAVYLQDSEGEQAVGADGWFTLLGLGMGLLCALVAFWRRRSGGVAVVLGLAAGGVLASVIAWRVGVALGPTTNVVAHADQVGANRVFDAPLVLHAKAALLTWPIGSMLGFVALTSLFTEDPAPVSWPGSGAGQGPQPASGAPWGPYTPATENPADSGSAADAGNGKDAKGAEDTGTDTGDTGGDTPGQNGGGSGGS